VTKLTKWFTPYEALKMVTYDNAQLLKLSRPRDPYPGKLGVVEEGALADLLLVDGNPLENIPESQSQNAIRYCSRNGGQ
jgi:imidazolonepropionase-like amidohydrolase